MNRKEDTTRPKVGDTICCHDAEEMVNTMMDLAEHGYDTDFVYEQEGERGYWLRVTEVHDEPKRR